MKGKRHTTKEKIRILREADSGKNINEVCQDRNISEVTFHRWKREFGMMDINEAKRLKELERENSELKKMLADSLLKNQVLEAINAKNGEPGAQATHGCLRSRRGPVFRAIGLPLSATVAGDVSLSGAPTDGAPVAVSGTHPHIVGGPPAVWLPPDRGAAAPRRLVREPAAGAACRKLARAIAAQTPSAPGVSTGLPTKATHRGHVWTGDFIADATVDGGALRMLTVLDEHTKEMHVLRPDRRIGSADVIALVKAAIAEHGAPEFIRSDNGPEFVAKDLQQWLAG